MFSKQHIAMRAARSTHSVSATRLPRDRATRFALFPAVVAAVIAGLPAVSAGGVPGLDQRPQNLTCVAPARPITTADVVSERVFANLSFAGTEPISLSQPPGDPSRWVLAGRLGEFFEFAADHDTTVKTVILDIADRMQFTDTMSLTTDSQQYGITSFAFHPQFPAQPYIYVAYNARPAMGDPVHSVVSRIASVDGGATFDEATEQILISIPHITPWAHVGELRFGPDGYLYIGYGDGGSRFTAQDLDDLRGSIVRIDVDSGSPYGIPPDNPLVGTGYLEEIYAWGQRNPWRFSFDRDTGDLWVGDVGAHDWEEVNRIEAGGNYGWPILEGNSCFVSPDCDPAGLEPPILALQHPESRAIIAGFVYRGTEIPELQGTFVWGDAAVFGIYGLYYDTNGDPYAALVSDTVDRVTSFAEALNGEVYFFRFRTATIYKLSPASPAPRGSTFPALLSETGCVDAANPQMPASGMIPYSINAPLWSDGADKDRWMALPEGTTIDLLPDGDFDFPVGTVLMKTFSFDDVPVETRLFMLHDDGWGGYSFEWNGDLSDAVLLPAGKVKEISPGMTWTYPSRNECMSCHTDAANFSLGPELAQLNGSFVYPSTMIEANQLDTLDHIGLFTAGLPQQPADLTALAAPLTSGVPIEREARSYLHANCSGCHRMNGPVQSPMDFRYSIPVEDMNVCDAVPEHGDLGIPDARLLRPGDPDSSIISARIHDTGVYRMPPLATAIVDTVGGAVVNAWIAQSDVCTVYPDTDADGVRDNIDNCTEVGNVRQTDTDADGYGNRCDGDFDNNGIVNLLDLSILRAMFGATGTLDTDMQPNGIVNTFDLVLFRRSFGLAPGPSAIAP